MNDNAKMLNALVMVAKLIFPHIDVKEQTINRKTDKGNVEVEYYVRGIEKGKPVAVISRGLIDINDGVQIEIIDGLDMRTFPLLGFNWAYLKVGL